MEHLTNADAPGAAIPQKPFGEKEDQRTPRVRRACLSCRKRKIKCSGDAPRCGNCIASDLECVYDQSRRDKLRSATSKNKDLVLLLKELSLRPSLDGSDRARIQDALEDFEDDSMSAVSVKSLKRRKMSGNDEPEEEDDRNEPTTARTQDPIDPEEEVALLDEDLLRSRKSRSTGYVGQGSGVQWLRSLQDRLKPDPNRQTGPNNSNLIERASAQKAGPATSVTDASFYLDADSAELDVDVDPYELPPQETAAKLFECYRQTVHKSFPILPPQFEEQFQRYLEAVKSEHPLTVPDKWLAILNIVFAIGARYSHLISAEWQGEHRDHLVYMTRSVRLLGSWPFAAVPDLALIQVSALLALYYQVIGHVSRGWVMIGISVRLALALGLHLRNEDPNIPLGKKEAILRTWWTLHAIECQLSAITGRPCVLGHEDCTVALPMTLSEETPDPNKRIPSNLPADKENSPTPASSSRSEKSRRLQAPRSYLDAHLNIGLIVQKLLSELYSPRVAQYVWVHIQDTIHKLLQELDDWEQGALPKSDLLRAQLFPQPEGPREHLLLCFYYFSTKILITRPCLCRSGRKIKDQSDASAIFDQRTAEACVEAALGLAGLLPNSDSQRLYENGPWWSIVHIIMQAMAVLLLELSYGPNYLQGDRYDVKEGVKKMFQWLSAMRHTDAVVERAYEVIIKILQQHRFKTMFNQLLATNDTGTDKDGQSIAPTFGHTHPEPSGYKTGGNMPQMPPTDWYGGPFANSIQPESAAFNPATSDLQTLAGLGGQSQAQQQLMSQMSQMPSQTEQDQYLEYSFTNQFMFSNPFMTNYDQDAPFGLTPDGLWPRAGASGEGDLAEEQGVNYPNFAYTMGQNPSSGPHQPQ